ncbi:FAD-dependent oxidoreductase [Agrococcus sp. 1P02AA]|uniref:FAD-dependent oxidoreductase n=1 Tax=Agrococcus sp. 1P02AA TaxID=3132259 RepID=UPI0039A4048F
MLSTDAESTPRGSTERQRAAWSARAEGERLTADVVVVGGGLGGIAAAVAAARRGAKVMVVEGTHMLGGQATGAAVSAMDVTSMYDKSLHEYGLWSEFVDRVKAIYRDELQRNVYTSRYRVDGFAPNVVVVERVLGEMLDDAGVRCFRNAPLEGMDRTVHGVRVRARGIEIITTLAVDATETGAVLRAARAGYRLGNVIVPPAAEPPDELHTVMIQDITLAAVVRRYDGGLPEWARMTAAPPSYWRYRGEAREYFPDSPGHQREGLNGFAGYRGTPDLLSDDDYSGLDWERISKTSLNFHNDQPVTAAYLEDDAARAAGDREALLRTLAILYYLQVELGLPWGLADDDGFDHRLDEPTFDDDLVPFAAMLKHLPLAPYVRESRRMLGVATLTGKDIFRRVHHQPARWDVDAVAVGTYPPDLHGGREEADLEKDLDESLSDKPSTWREGPFPIPLGALVPRRGGRILAAEKNISVSRIAAGAVRLHPTAMATGEAVGALAALAVRHDVPVDQVPSTAVQLSLAQGGALLAPVQIRGIDARDPRFVPISLAVCRRVVDWRYVRPVDDPHGEPWVEVDLARAEVAGRSLIALQSDWDATPGRSDEEE